MKHLALILIFLIGSVCAAQDTVWITKDSLEHTEWLSLIDSVMVGDANGSGAIDMDDVIYLLEHIFNNGPSPFVGRTADIYFKWTGECGVVLDSTGWPIDWIFKGRTGNRFGQVSGQEWGDTL